MVAKNTPPEKLFHQNKGKPNKVNKPKNPDNYWNWIADIERHEKTTKIGSAIFAFLELMGIQEKVYEQSAFAYWDGVVGEEIAKITTPRSISSGLLRVTVKDAAWRFELNLRAEEIRHLLNKRMGKTVVSKLIFR